MSIRVLVVDDHDSLRELFSVCLSFEDDLQLVGVAGDGLEAVDLAATLQPDAVVLDCHLPSLSGLDALPSLLEAAPGATVVMYSAWSDDGLSTLARARGAQAYMVKDRQGVGEVIAELRRLVPPLLVPHTAA